MTSNISVRHALLGERLTVISAVATAADAMHLERDFSRLEKCGIDWLHFDCMDGRFVPELTVGPAWIRTLNTPLVRDIHLLVEDPERHFAACLEAKADVVSFHLEACADPGAAIDALKAQAAGRPLVVGLALLPETPVETLFPWLERIDMALLLAVDPRGGVAPSFATVSARWQALREACKALVCPPLLCFDGGVKRENIEEIAALKPQVVVSGSALFKNQALEANATFMLSTLSNT
ncbi:MAG: ribulose-phosphate 3-epimerase [Magnetococcales bacterium]|nr:ribulose-phosphate 3-epimerase [Magnetococcales bacterium]